MRRAILVACFLLLAPRPAAAITISITGAQGAPGTDGESAVATAVSGDAENSATATGGDGGDSPSDGIAPGDGGSAEATAQTSVAGSAVALASALGGEAGSPAAVTTGGVGGASVANAIAESDAGATTAGAASTGGNGSNGGAGGTAHSSASGSNAGAESVVVEALAVGGTGGAADFDSPDSIGGQGGAAEIGPTYGSSSGGGTVRVRVEAVGGDGGDGVATSSVQVAGDGASVVLEDAVDGDTSGSLYLEQIARGGRAGEFAGGAPGGAASLLSVGKSLQALEITSLAVGALDAESSVIAQNGGGSITVHSVAEGGSGRSANRETAEPGGKARASAFASSYGDGDAVVVAPGSTLGFNAVGGSGGHSLATSQAGPGGRGGDGLSQSEGYSFGDSTVTVEDRAAGGDGGMGSDLSGPAGAGGDASSSASGGGSGPSPVSVSAYAQGGRGGAFLPYSTPAPGGRGGSARADSSAYSSGEVVSLATAIAGQGGFPFAPSGSAEARASALATSGEARADAHASGFELWALNAEASASVHSLAIVESRAAVGDPFLANSLGDLDTFAIAEGHPEPGDVQAATQGSAQVAGLFTGDAIDITLSLGRVGFTRLQEADGSAARQGAALTIIPNPHEVSALQDVMLGFMNPEFLGSGFDSLRFRANNRNETLIDVSFDELADALAYFDDRVLDLGGFAAGCTDGGGFGRSDFCFVSPLELIFDWMGSEQGDGFGVDLIVGVTPVPEPSTGLLLAIGLAVIAARERRRRRAAI